MSHSLHTERILLEKLLCGREEANLTEVELLQMQTLAAKLAKPSSRHHYIPQYYIKGFLGNDKLLSIYDKKRDFIKNERIGSNGIFYEKDANTVEIDNIKISIIEDHFFSKIDTEISTNLRKLRDQPVSSALTLINQTMVNAFIIDLFWRIPITNNAFDDMYQRSQITFQDKDGNDYKDEVMEQKLKNDPMHKKMEKSKMAIITMNDILAKRVTGQVFSKLWEFEQQLFVIGDYPMLFKDLPSNLTDLILLDFFVPISAERMFSSQRAEGLNFTIQEAYLFNALIIDQSMYFICSGNKEVLEKSVNYYRALKKKKLLEPLKLRLFERISQSKYSPNKSY